MQKKLIALAALISLSACSKREEKSLGSSISGPFAIQAKADGTGFFILNSAADGQTKDGNIISYSTASIKPEKITHVSAPRIGTDLDITDDGSILIAAFSGDNAQLRFYDVSTSENISEVYNSIDLGAGIISNLKTFKTPGQNAGDFYFTGTADAQSRVAKSFLGRVLNGKATLVLKFPLDLPGLLPTSYTLGYSAPVYIPSTGQLAFFPTHGDGAPPVPDPYDFQTGAKDLEPSNDIRNYSVFVTQIPATPSESNATLKSEILQSGVYTPIVRNELGEPVKANEEKKSESNKTLSYRRHFYRSIYESSSCTGNDTGNTNPRVIVAEENSVGSYIGQMFAISGWNTIKNNLANAKTFTPIGSPEEQARTYKYLPTGLVPSAYSNVRKIKDIDKKSLVSDFVQFKNNTTCFPLWARSEQDENSFGNENVRIMFNHGREASNPFRHVIQKGASVFTSVGNYVYAASYTHGNITWYSMDDESLTKAGTLP